MVEGPASNPQEEKNSILSDLLLWLALIPLILGVIICSGQLGLLMIRSYNPGDTASRLKADYAPWAYQIIPPIDIEAFLGDVAKEARILGSPTPAPVQTGVYWVPPTGTLEVALVNTNTPTIPPQPAVPTLTPTKPVLRTPTRGFTPTRGNTPTKGTPTVATATKTISVVTLTKVPPTLTHTIRPTNTATTRPTATRTRTPQPPPTLTFTRQPPPRHTNTPRPPTRTPVTPTLTFTNTPVTPPPSITPITPSPIPPTLTLEVPTVTPTYAPVRPIAENNGVSEIVPEGCRAYFGYRNDNPHEVDIPLGPRNTINMETVTINPEQTTHFLVDRQIGSFEVVWSAAGPITWTLDGRSATADWCQP